MDRLLPEVPIGDSRVGALAKEMLLSGKLAIYNLLLSPRLYWLTDFVPGLHLGETLYSPLAALGSGQRGLAKRVESSLVRRLDSSRPAAAWISNMLAELGSSKICDLPKECGVASVGGLLRYPVLIRDAELRNAVFLALDRAGLGVSRMYPAALPEIDGLQSMFSERRRFARASEFSREIITLPTHSRVNESDVAAMKRIMEKLVG